MSSPVPVAPSSGKIFQVDPSDHPVQRVCEQSLFPWDETPQRRLQLQRHQQARVIRTDHLNTHTHAHVHVTYDRKERLTWITLTTEWVPAGRPAENPPGSFLPAACRGDGCAWSPGSQCRCPEREPEPSAPREEPAPPSCGSTAADAPAQFNTTSNDWAWKVFTEQIGHCSGRVVPSYTHTHTRTCIAQRGTKLALLKKLLPAWSKLNRFYTSTGKTLGCLQRNETQSHSLVFGVVCSRGTLCSFTVVSEALTKVTNRVRSWEALTGQSCCINSFIRVHLKERRHTTEQFVPHYVAAAVLIVNITYLYTSQCP